MIAKNQIPVEQLRPELVALMRARYRAFRDAKFIQRLLLSLTILLPVMGVLTSANYPETRPYLALAALVLLLLDVGIIDPCQKDQQKRGAKLQDEFDVNVLSLPWNTFVAATNRNRSTLSSSDVALTWIGSQGACQFQLRRLATSTCAACNLAACATSLVTMVLPTGASARPASFRC